MPSFHIHLAVGKRYIDKNKMTDIDSFYKGIVAPDLVSDKKASHYTGERTDKTLRTYLKSKVVLKDYIQNNIINNEYEKGIFIHLITDYLFFNNFFPKDYIDNVSYDNFVNDLYYSYDLINGYLLEKYQIDTSYIDDIIESNIADSKKSKNISGKIPATNILPLGEVDKFIEGVSNINLEECKNKILSNIEINR